MHLRVNGGRVNDIQPTERCIAAPSKSDLIESLLPIGIVFDVQLFLSYGHALGPERKVPKIGRPAIFAARGNNELRRNANAVFSQEGRSSPPFQLIEMPKSPQKPHEVVFAHIPDKTQPIQLFPPLDSIISGQEIVTEAQSLDDASQWQVPAGLGPIVLPWHDECCWYQDVAVDAAVVRHSFHEQVPLWL